MKDKRTDEELNRIIAKWMGWKLAVDPNFNGLKNAGQNHGHRSIWWTEIPSYCSDLNAIHEAEKKLTADNSKNRKRYLSQLWDLIPEGSDDFNFYWMPTVATARQRAEALVAIIEGVTYENRPTRQ